MIAAAKLKEFEKAGEIKKQVFALEHIRDVSLIKRDVSEFMKDDSINQGGSPSSFRIEAYDVAHMQGSDMTGVMVVIEDGYAKKTDYRMFKIRRKGINDIASLREIVERRMKHFEWTMPDLVVTDGGEPQYNVARELFPQSVAVVGVVKNDKHRPDRLIGDVNAVRSHQKAILLANSEAHRFTLKYHRKLRSGSMFGGTKA